MEQKLIALEQMEGHLFIVHVKVVDIWQYIISYHIRKLMKFKIIKVKHLSIGPLKELTGSEVQKYWKT